MTLSITTHMNKMMIFNMAIVNGRKIVSKYDDMTDTDLLNCILGCDDNEGKLRAINEIMSAKRNAARAAFRKFLGGSYAST